MESIILSSLSTQFNALNKLQNYNNMETQLLLEEFSKELINLDSDIDLEENLATLTSFFLAQIVNNELNKSFVKVLKGV